MTRILYARRMVPAHSRRRAVPLVPLLLAAVDLVLLALLLRRYAPPRGIFGLGAGGPVITGVQDIVVTAGGSLDCGQGASAADRNGHPLPLTVDDSAVDPDVPGLYPITYRARDAAGRTAEVMACVYVVAQAEDCAAVKAVEAAADAVLAELFPQGLSRTTQRERMESIYWYCHDEIRYVSGSDKGDWLAAACRGLVERRGDCYVYAMAAKVLLTRAGIANRDIAKIPTETLHYWNLVDIGEGWHHFDATRRADGATFCYLTDGELMAYSDAHGGTHAYDRTLYTDIAA